MPGLIRKLLIYSSSDGAIIQSYGSAEHHKAICVSYSGHDIAEESFASNNASKVGSQLDSFGILGLLKIASLSFLVAVTGREQVAQVFGKPIYVITDIAVLPLSSKSDLDAAIHSAIASCSQNTDTLGSDDSESEDDTSTTAAHDVPSTPTEETIFQQRNTTGTSIAEDVARRKANYGNFASDWFSKQRQTWRSSKLTTQPLPDTDHTSKSKAIQHEPAGSPTLIVDEVAGSSATGDRLPIPQTATDLTGPVHTSVTSLLPKLLKSMKMILSSRSFFFSYEFDLTRSLSLQGGRPQSLTHEQLNPLYFWNKHMGQPFVAAGHEAYILPIVQGFIGQRAFSVRPMSNVDIETKPRQDKSFLLTLISRRSTKRSGLRYLRRGIDDEGNCANSAETEQILSSPDWSKQTHVRSFLQVRGSIPLYFSQTPYAIKPVPVFHNSPSLNQTAFKKHFKGLKDRYGAVQIVTLINQHGTEATIGDAYEKIYNELHSTGAMPDVSFEWFDFHAECKGMKFENVQLLVEKMESHIASWGETVICNGIVQESQKGVIRTNCMDCLDRTNVAQSAFGQFVLQHDLEKEGYDIDLIHDEGTNWFNTLWADNGDAISRQYASTAALKGDFTRTRKRNWRGQVNDLGLTLSRYYSNMVNDYFSQTTIDILLGNVSWRVLEDFESTMMAADPGVSVASAREAAIDNCAKLVIQGEHEDLIHGWTLLSPAQGNTLRTFPFEETVVLLTDAAIYCCKFDWGTEKVASSEKIDLRSISKIRYGAYVTSTFTELQLDEELNQGLVIVFQPGQGDVIRVNTRSLQNAVMPEAFDSDVVDGGTGVMSWFSHKLAPATSRTLALKVMPRDSAFTNYDSTGKAHPPSARTMAEDISEEIRRAIEGPQSTPSTGKLIEAGDIISAAEAKKRTGYLEQLGYSIKRLVWT